MYIKDKKTSKRDYINNVRRQEYKIISAVPSSKTSLINLENIKTPKKMIFTFGYKKKGLIKEIISNSNLLLNIPTYGFSENYNISVSCAIVLNKIMSLSRQQGKIAYLANEERDRLRLEWYKKSIKNSKL